MVDSSLTKNDSETVDKIIKHYANHWSLCKTKNNQIKDMI